MGELTDQNVCCLKKISCPFVNTRTGASSAKFLIGNLGHFSFHGWGHISIGNSIADTMSNGLTNVNFEVRMIVHCAQALLARSLHVVNKELILVALCFHVLQSDIMPFSIVDCLAA